MHLHGHEVPVQTVLLGFHQCIAANELALVGMHEAVETGLVGVVLDRQFARHETIALLNRQR